MNISRLARKIRKSVVVECDVIILQESNHYLIEVRAYRPGGGELAMQHRISLEAVRYNRLAEEDLEGFTAAEIGASLRSVWDDRPSE